MDGEDSLIDVELIDEHVAGCVACQTWAAAAVVVGRRLRVREAVTGPDLSEAIVAAAESGEPGRRSGRGDAVVRWALPWGSSPSSNCPLVLPSCWGFPRAE